MHLAFVGALDYNVVITFYFLRTDIKMPKIIKDAKETIVKKARVLLAENGVSKLNMRALAESAGLAAGTLYNYFPSKEDLISEVVHEDFSQMLKDLEEELADAGSSIDGIEMIFHAISDHREKHSFLWDAMNSFKKAQKKQLDYHREMIKQIGDRVRILGERFGFISDPTVAPFISEVLLAAGSYPGAQFSFLAPSLKRIVGETA